MQPNTTYVVDPTLGPNQPSGGLYSRAAYGPGGTGTTTVTTKETDIHTHAAPPMMTGAGYGAGYGGEQVQYDKHGKAKKQKKDKKSKKTKGHDQVIVPPGPAIVPAVVIPVMGLPPMNSAFMNPQMMQQQYGNQQMMQQPQAGFLPAPTSGVLPPTGVQNPMTATLPINQQGFNPTANLGNNALGVQPPIMSSPGYDAAVTKEMIANQHSHLAPGAGGAFIHQAPMQKTTVLEERKEVISQPGMARPF